MYIFLVFSTAFFIIGNQIKNKEKYNLIPFYNSLSKEQRKKVDMKGLSKLVGNLCFFWGTMTLLLALYVNKSTIVIYITLFYGSIFYLLYNRSKYDKRIKEGNKILRHELIIAAISFIIIVIYVLMS